MLHAISCIVANWDLTSLSFGGEGVAASTHAQTGVEAIPVADLKRYVAAMKSGHLLGVHTKTPRGAQYLVTSSLLCQLRDF